MLRIFGRIRPSVVACSLARRVLLSAVVLAFTCLATPVRAEQTASIRLSVKPGLCLRFAKTERCTLEVHIDWFSSEAGEYCIFSELDRTEAIRCWVRSSHGQTQTTVSIEEDVKFWLSDQSGELVHAEKSLKIANVVNNEKRSRHNRRHIWNLI